VGKEICICGDFNDVRSMEERRSLRTISSLSDAVPFNRFIEENLLVDDSLRSYIDRFLLLEDWCLVCPNCLQVAHLRGLSDHCPLFLTIDEQDWGPRPSRMLKCCTEVLGYKQFVREKWKSFEVVG